MKFNPGDENGPPQRSPITRRKALLLGERLSPKAKADFLDLVSEFS